MIRIVDRIGEGNGVAGSGLGGKDAAGGVHLDLVAVDIVDLLRADMLSLHPDRDFRGIVESVASEIEAEIVVIEGIVGRREGMPDICSIEIGVVFHLVDPIARLKHIRME